MSRRQRQRGDKRDRFDTDLAPELVAAFEQIRKDERDERDEAEPRSITTTYGQRVDLTAPWQLPKGLQP